MFLQVRLSSDCWEKDMHNADNALGNNMEKDTKSL